MRSARRRGRDEETLCAGVEDVEVVDKKYRIKKAAADVQVCLSHRSHWLQTCAEDSCAIEGERTASDRRIAQLEQAYDQEDSENHPDHEQDDRETRRMRL